MIFVFSLLSLEHLSNAKLMNAYTLSLSCKSNFDVILVILLVYCVIVIIIHVWVKVNVKFF